MKNIDKDRWVDYVVLSLSVFLTFCLLFESFIALPTLIGWLGRWHPLMLHFPIVLLLIGIFLGLMGKRIPELLLTIAVLSALVTAVLGFFLGMETPVKGELLFLHQWLGGATALGSSLWYVLYRSNLGTTLYAKALQLIMVALIVLTGHYGGMVTHGEAFLALPTDEPKGEIPKNPLVYQDIVYRILDNKCISCHNLNKQKGELLMTSFAELMKGGEHGPIVIAGNPQESEIIKRVHLPIEDEMHMPPEGKTPLDKDEIEILEEWISLGASDTIRLNALPKSGRLAGLIKDMMKPDTAEKWQKLPKVADSTLQNLASDYLSVSRIANSSEALSVVFFNPPKYNAKFVTDLKRIAKNIVELDLSGLPIGSGEIDAISTFTNLEKLELDKTPVGDAEVKKLSLLQNLRLLKIYETDITDLSMANFEKLSALKNLYIYQTDVSAKAVIILRNQRPDITVNDGVDVDVARFFKATDSLRTAR